MSSSADPFELSRDTNVWRISRGTPAGTQDADPAVDAVASQPMWLHWVCKHQDQWT